MNRMLLSLIATTFLGCMGLQGQSTLPSETPSSKEKAGLKLAAFIFIPKAGGEAGVGYTDQTTVHALRGNISTDFLYFHGESSSFVLTDEHSLMLLRQAKVELDEAVKESLEKRKALAQSLKNGSTVPPTMLQQPQSERVAFDKWQRTVFALIIDAMASHREIPITKYLP